MADLPRVSGLQLTAADLHALGAVVAQWAVAEVIIRRHVQILADLTTNTAMQERRLPQQFQKLQESWKELLRDVCKGHDRYIKVGVSLAGAAKNMRQDRDAAVHWPGSRSGFRLDVPADFVKVDIRTGTTRRKSFSTAELLILSENIHQLYCDVNFFDLAIVGDLFPSRCTWHGQKPNGAILDTRPIPTILKPIHQQRSFRR
jgi:hypothetical protein